MSGKYTTDDLVRFINRMVRGCGQFEPKDSDRMVVLIWRLQAADVLYAAAKEIAPIMRRDGGWEATVNVLFKAISAYSQN
ncbi:MAG: hypothetical protein IMZ71_01495 [Chloroflexi bacterium]|nr:hypothetical protein [Chloroflexota bacterium]